MEEKELKTGSACFLVKDERLKKNWHETPIFDFIEKEGFVCWEKSKKSIEGIDWLFINIYSKVYAKGAPGISLAPVVCEHAITFDEFLTIYNIYKKYEGLDVLKMNQAEQDEFDQKHPYRKMCKIIGCSEVTHEVLQNYINSGWWNREMLPWEHCGMRFQKLCVSMKKSSLGTNIYYCNYNDKPYYFGVDLKEPVVTDDMLENGKWFVYTWAD